MVKTNIEFTKIPNTNDENFQQMIVDGEEALIKRVMTDVEIDILDAIGRGDGCVTCWLGGADEDIEHYKEVGNYVIEKLVMKGYHAILKEKEVRKGEIDLSIYVEWEDSINKAKEEDTDATKQ